MMMLCNSLRAMHESNLSILQSFKILENHKEKKSLRFLARDIKHDLEHGDTLTEACHKQQKLLSPFFVAMVGAGERSGTLPNMFGLLERYYTDAHQNIQRLKRTALYPILVLSIIFFFLQPLVSLVRALLLGGSYADIFTSVLATIISILVAVIPYIIILRILFKLVSKETILIWFWPFAPLMRKMLMSRFAFAMALLCKTSTMLPNALVISAKVTSSGLIVDEAKHMGERIKKGEALSEVLRGATYFPGEHYPTIVTGEKSGKLDEAFEHVAESLYKEVQHNILMFIEKLKIVFVVFLVLGFFVNPLGVAFSYLSALLPF